MAGFGTNFFINHGVVFNSKPAVEVSNEEKQEDVTKQISVTDSTSTVSEQVGNEKVSSEDSDETFSTGNKKGKNKRGEV